MHRFLFVSLFLFPFFPSFAQSFRLTGKITNTKLEPLPLVSIQLKGSVLGAVSKTDGTYELEIYEGEWDVVFSMTGYRSQLIHLVINRNTVQNIILELDDAKNLSEVVIRGKLRDRSEEYIRNVIRHKDELLAAAGNYSCRAYIKAVQEDSSARKSKKKVVTDTSSANAAFAKMSLAEVSLVFDHATDNRVKEDRKGVARRGNPESLFFLSLTEGDFNLYYNLLQSRVLATVPFLSPISYSGLAAYRYRVTHTRQEGNRKYYTISVKPRQLSNVTVEGEVIVMDSAWVITDSRFTLPSYHLPEYDFFEVTQHYDYVNSQAWMITRQQFRYFSKHGKGKLSGETIARYSDFELQKQFPKHYFGTEVSSTTLEAYERDSSFWQHTRTEPLTEKEVRYIRYRDSIYRVTHSKGYLDSLDRVTNRFTWKKLLLFGQDIYSREKERTWRLPALLEVYNPLQFGGGRLRLGAMYNKVYKSRKVVTMDGEISYGLRNHDINGNLGFYRLYNPYNRGYYSVNFERDFAYIFEGDAWINMVKRNNFYLNNGLNIRHGWELVNGLFIHADADFAFRRSVSDYKTNPRLDSLLGDILDDNQAVSFDGYNAVYGQVRVQYTPWQRYIREPREKVILGSKWPTFYVSLRKGIPGPFDSKVDFDYLEFGIEQELKLGVTGVSRYKILSGSFLNQRDLRLVDYKFQRRGDPVFFMNPNEAFQSLDSTFPVFRRFYQAHYVHEFNGALLNKIPFLKKLQLREMAGGGFLVAKERNLRYAEAFAGIERVFKWPFNPLYRFKFGVYVVGSAANQFRNPVQFKIGFTSWDRRRNKWL